MIRHSFAHLNLVFAVLRLSLAAAVLIGPVAAFAQPPALTPVPTPADSDKPADGDKPGEDSIGDESDNVAEDKPATDKEKFAAALDEFEAEIISRERQGTYGHPQAEGYAKELEAEYFANEEALKKLSTADPSDAVGSRQEITSRQQHISMLLWQLQRVGTQLAQPSSHDNRLTTKIHQLLSQYRGVMKDLKLMQRFHDLSRRASDLTRISLTSRYNNNFHFVRPMDSTVGSPIKPKVVPDNATGVFEIGPIQSLKEPIGNLVRLSWKDGFLAWDEKHWEVPFAGRSLNAIDQEVRDELTNRGVKFPEEDRMGVLRRNRLLETPRSMLLFQDLQYIASQGKSARRSSSTSGSTAQSSFSAGGVEAAIKVAPNKSEFSVHEDSDPDRRLLIRRGRKSELRVSLIGDDILLLEQAADGAIRWVDIGEEVTAIRAKSFAELYANHPEAIEKQLFARLQHCGIQTPMPRFDPQLVARILDRISGVDDQTKTRFNELLEKIDSGSFAERQKAYREIENNVSEFSMLIAQTSEKDGRSPEAASRLAELRKKYGKQFRELDTLITKSNWLKDPNYLLGLIGHVDDQHSAAVTGQLEVVTGQSFGQNLGRWRQWLSEQPKD